MRSIRHLFYRLTSLSVSLTLVGCLQTNNIKPDLENSSASLMLLTKGWQLQTVQSKNRAEVNDLQLDTTSPLITLRLTPHTDNNQVTAHGVVGCNQWKGHAILSETHLTLQNAASTRKRCHYPNKTTERMINQFLPTLAHPHTHRMSGGELYLEKSDDPEAPFWIFQAESH